MQNEFQVNDCSKAIICNLYREVPLHTRINNKGLLLPMLACKATPGIYFHLYHKYQTKRGKGELKVLTNQLNKYHC